MTDLRPPNPADFPFRPNGRPPYIEPPGAEPDISRHPPGEPTPTDPAGEGTFTRMPPSPGYIGPAPVYASAAAGPPEPERERPAEDDSGNGGRTPPEVPPAVGAVVLGAGVAPPSGDGHDRVDTGEPDTDALPPIVTMFDMRVQRVPVTHSPVEAYASISSNVHEAVVQAAGGDTSPALQDEIVHHLALQRLLGPKLIDQPTAALEAEHQATMAPRYEAGLARHGLSYTELEARAAQLEPTQVAEYLLGKLRSHTDYLATGTEPTNWPEAANPGDLTECLATGRVQITEELVRLSLDHLGPELGDALPGLVEGHTTWVNNTYNLLVENGYIGLAIPLIRAATTPEQASAMIDDLTVQMSVVRDEDGQDYRDLYRFAVDTLPEPQRTEFREQTPHLPAEFINTATRKAEPNRHGGFDIVERFEEPSFQRALLADGSTIELPFMHYATHTIESYGGVETDRFGVQRSVQRLELDRAATQAVETAWRAQMLDRLREETSPHYRRIALDENGLLHTVRLAEGANRPMSNRPYEPTVGRPEAEPLLDQPILSAQFVATGYMVVPAHGTLHPATYRDSEPNFFGPGEGRANAFWVAGDARDIVDPGGSFKYMDVNGGRGGYAPRVEGLAKPLWSIVPVVFYQVETVAPGEPNDSDRRFF